PTARPSAETETVATPGVVPDAGLRESQGWSTLAVHDRLPVPAFPITTVTDPGSEPPLARLNAREPGDVAIAGGLTISTYWMSAAGTDAETFPPTNTPSLGLVSVFVKLPENWVQVAPSSLEKNALITFVDGSRSSRRTTFAVAVSPMLPRTVGAPDVSCHH